MTRRHPVGKSMPESLQHGHTQRSFCLLSDLTMKTNYPYISYVHIQTLGYEIIYIPVKNNILENKLAQNLTAAMQSLALSRLP